MSAPLHNAVQRLINDQRLNAEESAAAFEVLMRGDGEDGPVAAFLTALACRGETSEMLTGAARVLRQHATQITPQAAGLLDTCGTGGDRLHTFNISTAAALVAAACGVPVAKHGNRSVSSSSGSADVLESLGVRLSGDPEQVARCVDEIGIGFLFARELHPAMRHVADVRRQLGFRTVFNLLGPLVNPAAAAFHLLGAGDLKTARLLADTVAQLGVPAGGRTVVVCGNNQIDEVSLWGTTSWFSVDGSGERDAGTWTEEDFELAGVEVSDLRVDTADESAAVIRGVLADDRSPAWRMTIANAAAALWCAGHAESVGKAARLAANAVADGKARDTLQRLVSFNRPAPGQ